MSLIPQSPPMSNTCVSRLLIPDSDQIQIVVTKVVPERGKGGSGGTDITVTSMSRGGQLGSVGQTQKGGLGRRKLPPLVIPEKLGNNLASGETRTLTFLSPENIRDRDRDRSLSPVRIPSPSSNSLSQSQSSSRRSSTNSEFGKGSLRASTVTASSSVPASPTSTKTSRYHRTCCIPNSSSSPSAFPQLGSKEELLKRRASHQSVTPVSVSPRSRSRSPYRGANSRHSGIQPVNQARKWGMSADQVEDFLLSNPEFLENYVTRNVDQETLECWLIDRQKVAHSRKSSLSRWKYGSGSDTRKNMLQELAKSLQRNSQEGSVMWELALCISSAVCADSYTLYLADNNEETLQRFVANNNTNSSTSPSPKPITLEGEDAAAQNAKAKVYSMSEGLTMAAYVGQRRSPLRLSRSEAEARFPEGLGENPDSLSAVHILCHPIVRADGELAGVVELHRNNASTPFYSEDEEVVNSYVVWGGIALHYAELNAVMNKQKKLNDFLLNVVKSIFQDMVSMDTLIKKVMNYAQKLVDADRASLFLLDNKNKELYARLFDMGGGQDLVLNPDASTKEPAKEIRFSIGTGIAGQVAATGQILNIPDAYADDRFNRAVDQITGYHTKSILCMPVFIRATVIGVVQMVNKRTGSFTKDDEDAFQTFAVYCGLALHHAKLYDKIRRSEQKFKVALEVLSYHNTCPDDEFVLFKAHGVPSNVLGLDDYYFVSMSVDDNLKVHYTLYMFIDLFGLSRFDSDHLYRFVLTVRKNYRRVPYHNWTHGFAVANSMYCILKKSNVFRPLECLALFVGCLCHDLDHRGRSNKFMLDTASPLASIYTTSTMEHHHFNQTVTILQQEGHNIFSKLSSEEYKQALGNIKHCILATDLALFFPNKARLNDLVQREAFSWGVPDHRLLIEAIAMTAADLCASTKAWDAQVETVRVIFEEFYEQGDLEKMAGRVPIPMMDREKKDEQAASQVGFLSGICVPCYSLLERIIPETKPLLDGVQRNLSRWTDIAAEKKALKEARGEGEEDNGGGKDVKETEPSSKEAEEEEKGEEKEGEDKGMTNGPGSGSGNISPNPSKSGSGSPVQQKSQVDVERQDSSPTKVPVSNSSEISNGVKS